MASAALSGDLEKPKDSFESDDRSFYSQRPGVEEANLPDVPEHWTRHEYVELACWPREGQADVTVCRLLLWWMEGQESTEAFDFAFGPHE